MISDTFEGEILQAWDDGEFININSCINMITLSIPKEEWARFKTEMSQILMEN